jgi:predicted NBD/HSP70 family sugar kinase
MVEPKRLSGLGVAGASNLFQLLRDGQPRTRAELASMTGLARSTIGLRIDRLLELDLIRLVGESISSGGRPPSQFALNHTARLVVGADFGASHAAVALTDLSGNILGMHREALPIADGPERVLEWLVATTRTLMADIGREDTDLLAIGMGLPGPVERVTGRPVNPPIMPGWNGFDVPGWIFDRLGIPALVDNDVNIMAIAEHTLAFPDTEDMMFVKVATGIGSGIISGGTLQRGAQGSAGDIGHVGIQRGGGIACHCGNVGCLEVLASGPAIARQLRESGASVENTQQVIELVRRGNPDAIQAVRQAGRDIGEVLATCVSLLNPSVLVLGGSVTQAGEHLLAGVREVVYRRSAPLATEHLSIVQSRTAANAAVLGASMLAIQHMLSPEAIDEMPSSADQRVRDIHQRN